MSMKSRGVLLFGWWNLDPWCDVMYNFLWLSIFGNWPLPENRRKLTINKNISENQELSFKKILEPIVTCSLLQVSMKVATDRVTHMPQAKLCKSVLDVRQYAVHSAILPHLCLRKYNVTRYIYKYRKHLFFT